MEFLQDHVAHRHRQRGVGALRRVQPEVGELGDLGVVGRHRDDLGALVADLGEEVRVGRARLRHVAAPGHDERRVVPVGRLGHVGLLAPGLRRRRRQVAVPVVEAHAHAADQRQVAAAGGVGDHRHRRDRREADDAVGAVLLDRVDVGRGDDLVDLVPLRADEAAEAADRLVRLGLDRVLDDRRPGLDRPQRLARLAPQADEAAAHHRVLQPVGAVHVPGVRRAARAAARLVVGHVGPRARVVGLLRLPGDDAALDVDLPAARAGAVDAVGRAHDLVVRPAVAVGVLPGPVLRGHDAVAVGERFLVPGEVRETVEKGSWLDAEGRCLIGRFSTATRRRRA